MTAEESRQAVENYWEAMATNHLAKAEAWLYDDFVLDWPQSGERVRGWASFAAINANYPVAGRWRFAVHRLIAAEGRVASEIEVSDGSTTAIAITFSELREGKILRQVECSPDPFPPAPWRRRGVERIT